MPKYSNNLKLLRKQAGLTQQELADRTGLSRSRINNYEQGIRGIEKSIAEIFADFFNVDLDYFYARSSSPYDDRLLETEAEMLDAYRELNAEGQRKVYDYVLDLINCGRYSKKDSAVGLLD